MKLSEGWTRLWPSIGVAVFYTLSLGCLTLALRGIEVSMAYAVWSGIGTALIAVVGILYFQESLNALKAASLVFVILGVAGLHLSSTTH